MVKLAMRWITDVRDLLFKKIAQKISAKTKQGRVRDVGTRKGWLPIKIAQNNSNLEIYGIYISDKAIMAARKNAIAANLKNPPDFKVGNVSNLSFRK
jgi:methylase of polypeptide subunit release factors